MSSQKTRAMSVGTPVLVVGLEHDLALNDKVGEVQQPFDGHRYTIKLANGARVRVTPDKCTPVCPDDFVEHTRRLTTELCVFARTNNGGPTSLLSFDAAILGKGRKALSAKLDRIELCSADNMLLLYEDGADTAYAQLKRIDVPPPCAALNVNVLDFDVPTAARILDVQTDIIEVSCRNFNFFFENRMPTYHMRRDHMLSYMSERTANSVINNLFDIARYLNFASDLEHVCYDPATRVLFYKLKSSDIRGTIVSPMWTPDEFMVAHHGNMTGSRLAFIRRAARGTAPTRVKHVFPIGSRAVQADDAVVIVEEGSDHSGLAPSVDTFLQTQLVLCAHIVEYGAMCTVEPNLQRHASSILMYIVQMLRDHSHDEHAQLAHDILMRNICTPTNFLLPASFMDDIYENGDKSTAWLANLEALGQAFTLVLDPSMNVTIALDDGLFKVTQPTPYGVRVYVASFANDPIENQAWIFQKELRDIDDDVLQPPMSIEEALFGIIQSPSSVVATIGATAPGGNAEDDDATSVADASADPEQQTAVDDADTALSRSLQLQAELIQQEEQEASAPAAPVANKKKKKKKKRATTPSVCEQPLQAEHQVPSAHPKPPDGPSEGRESRELHEVQRSQSASIFVPNYQPSQDVVEAAEPADFVHVVGSRSSARAVARLKQHLTDAQRRIQTLEAERATFATRLECELDKQRTGFHTEMQRACNAFDAKIAQEVATHNAAFNEMREQRDHALTERDEIATDARCAHGLATKHMNRMLDNIANQLRRYLAGHYMKLDPVTLSIAAVRRDGFVAMLLINLYREFVNDLTVDEVVALAVHTTSDMALTGQGGVTLVAPSH